MPQWPGLTRRATKGLRHEPLPHRSTGEGGVSYRKHSVSKGTRRAHHKREKARRRKLREARGQIEPFGYTDTRGMDKAGLRRLSVSKGARDGSPAYSTAEPQ